MKVDITEHIGSLYVLPQKFIVTLTITPESLDEAFRLGQLSLKLRRENIWCAFDQGNERHNPYLQVQIEGGEK